MPIPALASTPALAPPPPLVAPTTAQVADALPQIDRFVASSHHAVFVRRVDRLLLIRPEKTLAINDSALEILEALYDQRRSGDAAQRLAELAPRLGVELPRLVRDAAALLETVGALLREDFSPRPNIRFGHFDRGIVRYPILAEIALTYGCQNRCAFCYAASPHRAGEHRLMRTDEVKRVMRRIFEEGHVPSLSFTGGESTLRPDLPELITFGHELGFRVNLITNGIRLADEAYARTLVDAHLDAAQVSIEAGSAGLHDRVVGRAGAFDATVAGVRNLRRLGIHLHTNTTLCRANLDAAPELIRFIGRELGMRKMSMNMLIPTGAALGSRALGLRYAEVGERLPRLIETARAEEVRLIWYSPLPYCVFNPVLHGLGAKACACIDGLLSVDPSGQVLPCSSFGQGIGSLLDRSFDKIYRSRAAAYWRRKEFLPPACRGCDDADVCAGGCPLYWDAAGSFAELPRAGAGDEAARRRWERARRRGGSYGVSAPAPATARSEAWDG